MIMMYFNVYFYVLKMIRKLMLAIHKNWRGEGWIQVKRLEALDLCVLTGEELYGI